jgi:uncharacterized protein (TIGR03083 family)
LVRKAYYKAVDMDGDKLWTTIHHERARLVDLLATLTEDEWNHPSLCALWRVRDVAAHVISSADSTTLDVAVAALRSGGNFNRLVDRMARRQGARPPAEILDRYRRSATSRARPPLTKPLDPLVDVLVHSQDIAIPLGRDHPMPIEPAREAAAFVWSRGFPYDAQRKHAGTRFVATDVDFTAGEGETVEAPIAAILLRMTGRQPAWTDCG